MNRLTLIMKSVLDKDFAVLVEAGVLNKDLSVGHTELALAYMFKYLLDSDPKFKKGIAEIARERIEKEEKSSK